MLLPNAQQAPYIVHVIVLHAEGQWHQLEDASTRQQQQLYMHVCSCTLRESASCTTA